MKQTIPLIDLNDLIQKTVIQGSISSQAGRIVCDCGYLMDDATFRFPGHLIFLLKKD